MALTRQLKRPYIQLTRLACASLAAVAFVGATPDAFAASCPGSDAKPSKASRAIVTGAMLCLINAERRKRGLVPLKPSGRLAVAARRHSRDMVRRGYFSHTTPAGSGFVLRIRRTGYLGTGRHWRVGENIAWGWREHGSAHAIVQAWMKSQRHRKAILTRAFRDAGIGVAMGVPTPLPTGGATFTAEFGTRGH